MKIGNWLKKVILFPAMAFGIFGNEGGEPSLSERIMQFIPNDNSQFLLKEEDTGKPDAAASEDTDQGADLGGNPGEVAENGLDTASDEDDLPAEEEEGEADETDQKDEEGKGTKKKTFEERMAEIEAKQEAKLAEKLAELEAKYKAQQQPVKEPDFFVPDEEKINAWLRAQNEKITEAELEDKTLLAEQLKREKFRVLDEIEAETKASAQKRAEWEKEQAAKKSGSTEQEALLNELAKSAEFFRSEMKIDSDVWNKMGAFFTAECQKNPILGRKFDEKVKMLSPIEAVEWAHKYTLANMGKEAKAATEKKEQTKTKTAAVSAAQTATVAPVDLKAIKATYDANPSEENFAKYMEAKRKQKA